MRIFLVFCMIASTWPLSVYAEDGDQPYAGLETRDITSLSDNDIAELEAGRGWGLALPAELNGYPGPTHVLELADALELSARQRSQILEIFKEMQEEAIAAGAELIAAERALDQSFADSDITVTLLDELTKAAASARRNLRFIHLSRHLQTIGILNKNQVERYGVLRGYAADACSPVPNGHNAEMWRRHNNCVD
jgi:hypothetical protein